MWNSDGVPYSASISEIGISNELFGGLSGSEGVFLQGNKIPEAYKGTFIQPITPVGFVNFDLAQLIN